MTWRAQAEFLYRGDAPPKHAPWLQVHSSGSLISAVNRSCGMLLHPSRRPRSYCTGRYPCPALCIRTSPSPLLPSPGSPRPPPRPVPQRPPGLPTACLVFKPWRATLPILAQALRLEATSRSYHLGKSMGRCAGPTPTRSPLLARGGLRSAKGAYKSSGPASAITALTRSVISPTNRGGALVGTRPSVPSGMPSSCL